MVGFGRLGNFDVAAAIVQRAVVAASDEFPGPDGVGHEPDAVDAVAVVEPANVLLSIALGEDGLQFYAAKGIARRGAFQDDLRVAPALALQDR
jgi:hypothetical protein